MPWNESNRMDDYCVAESAIGATGFAFVGIQQERRILVLRLAMRGMVPRARLERATCRFRLPEVSP
jgi:hypothetical protein